MAEQYIKSYNLEDKIKTKSFDFFKEDIPKGYDVAFLSLILHDYSDEKGIGLLKKIYNGLANDGVVIISEWLLNDEKTGPAASALMGLNMLVESYGCKKLFICRDCRHAQSGRIQESRKAIPSGTC